MSEPTRAYIYRVATALIPILILIGWIATDDVDSVLALIAAVLSIPVNALAAKNTSTG